MADRCECGWLALDAEPEDYRRAAALVAAYLHGESELFDEVLDEAGLGVLAATAEGAAVALAMLAEAQDRSLSSVLEDWCSGAAHVAGDRP